MAAANRALLAPHRSAVAGPFSVREPAAAGAATEDLAAQAVVQALVFPEMVALGTADPAMAFRETAIRVTRVQVMADQETVDQETVDQETAAPATEVPATADLAPAVPATADLATETETVDPSTEEAFFERSLGLSDPPVSFDIEPEDAPFDFESREERRAYFKRVVGGIIATLGVGSLLALTRPGPRPPEPLPAAAIPEAAPQTLEFEPIVEAAQPAASAALVSVEPAPVVEPAPMAEPVPSVAPSASARSARPARKSAPAPRVFVPPPSIKTPSVAPSVNRSPPTARFAD
jgi:hypothetical protein